MPLNEATTEVAQNMIAASWKETHGTDAGCETVLPKLLTEFKTKYAELEPRDGGERAYNNALDHVRNTIRNHAPQARIAQFEATAKQRFLAAGGTEAEFRQQWPQIKADHLRGACNNSNDLEAQKRASARRAVFGGL